MPIPNITQPPPSPLDKLTPLQSPDCANLGINCPQTPTGLQVSNYMLGLIVPLLTLAGIVFVAALVYGGIMYIISTGDESKSSKAKLVIIYAIAGLLIIGIAGIVVNVLLKTNPPTPPSF